jgi:hypothetical protein
MNSAPALAVCFFVATTSYISASVFLRLTISFFKAGSSFLIMLESLISVAMSSMVSSLKRTSKLGCHVQGSREKAVGVGTLRTFLGVDEKELLDELAGGLECDRLPAVSSMSILAMPVRGATGRSALVRESVSFSLIMMCENISVMLSDNDEELE